MVIETLTSATTLARLSWLNTIINAVVSNSTIKPTTIITMDFVGMPAHKPFFLELSRGDTKVNQNYSVRCIRMLVLVAGRR